MGIHLFAKFLPGRIAEFQDESEEGGHLVFGAVFVNI
jgi:hypothetical protein